MTTEADLKSDISQASWREQLWKDRRAEADRNIKKAQDERLQAEAALAEMRKK